MSNATDIERVKLIKQKYADFLQSLPHVKGLGVGKKTIGGRPTETIAIKVYVDQKVSRDKLAEKELVPPDLDEIPTDVELISELRAR